MAHRTGEESTASVEGDFDSIKPCAAGIVIQRRDQDLSAFLKSALQARSQPEDDHACEQQEAGSG